MAEGPSAPARVHARTRWWAEALVIAWLCWVYDAITNLAPLNPLFHDVTPDMPFDEGILIWDVKDPENPKCLSHWST